MNLGELVLLLGLLLLVVLFWNWRRQEEQARQYAKTICQQHELQFLDLSRDRGRPVYHRGPVWQAEFVFGFSSDGSSRYEGRLTLLNLRLSHVDLPAYRINVPADVTIRYD